MCDALAGGAARATSVARGVCGRSDRAEVPDAAERHARAPSRLAVSTPCGLSPLCAVLAEPRHGVAVELHGLAPAVVDDQPRRRVRPGSIRDPINALVGRRLAAASGGQLRDADPCHHRYTAPESADSRSRPQRRSAPHTGPRRTGSVSAERPSQGSASPLCYLGWSRFRLPRQHPRPRSCRPRSP